MRKIFTLVRFPILFYFLFFSGYLVHGQVNFIAGSGGTNLFSTVVPASLLSSGGTAEYTLVVDLNSDGRPDLVTADKTVYTPRVWLNNGSGFTQVTSAGAGNPLNGLHVFDPAVNHAQVASQLLPADYDGDGDQDIYDSWSGKYYINSGSSYSLASGAANIFSVVTAASYFPAIDGGGTAEYVLVVDLNTDRRPDLVTIDRTAYTQHVWLNNGSGFTQVTSSGAGNPLNGISLLNLAGGSQKVASHLVPADFDADGDKDIYDSWSGQYYINSGSSYSLAAGAANIFSGVAAVSHLSNEGGGSNSEYALVIDFNTDGLPDMVTIDRTTFAQRIWRNTGSGFTEVTNAGAAGNPLNGIQLMDNNVVANRFKTSTQMIVADFDNDGDQDVFDSYTGSYYYQGLNPPILTSTTPADNGVSSANRPEIVLNFDENISSRGTGLIQLRRSSDDALIASMAGNNAAIAVSGSQARFTFGNALTPNAGYYLLVGTRAFFDADGMTFPGINNKTTFNFTMASILPLTLIDFSGKLRDGQTSLNWTTANESNTATISVERSYDGVNFSTAGTLKAFGSGDHAYQFSERLNTGTTVVYYKLKMADLDGRHTYSHIITLRSNENTEGKFQVYPSPAAGFINLVSPVTGAVQAELSIINQQGIRVLQQPWRQQQRVSVSHLSPGIYVAQLAIGHEVYTTTFMKVK